MDILEKFGLMRELKSLALDADTMRARFRRTPYGHPDFLEFHIRNASGWSFDFSVSDDGERYELDEIEGEQLRSGNPKGRLLELEQIGIVKMFSIDVSEAEPSGFQASGMVRTASAIFMSSIHYSRTKKKHAEQSAAAELFNFAVSRTKGMEHTAFVLGTKRLPEAAPAKVLPDQKPAPAPDLTPGLDARQRLNEMVQKGIFSGFEYVEKKQGPDNEPVFFCVAKVLSSQGWISGRSCSAHTKKKAQAAAAEDLMEQLIERSKRRPSVQEQMKNIREGMSSSVLDRAIHDVR
jgi:hypothetical protein